MVVVGGHRRNVSRETYSNGKAGSDAPETVYLANSHGWLYEKLLEHALPDADAPRLVETRSEADLIIYLDPPWPDPDAPDRLRSFRSARDLSRICVFSQADKPLPWAPGMYCSLETERARVGQTGGFYVSQHHRDPRSGFYEDLEAARDRERDLLWSFMGTFSNHPVRHRLSAIHDSIGVVRNTQHFSDVVRWGWGESNATEGREAFSDYAALIGRSAFVLCPRGVGASSARIFEALQVGRCPVVVADDWMPPPFVDWSSCSLRVPEAMIEKLPTILRDHEHESKSLGDEARKVWERFFSPEKQLVTLLLGCVAMHRQVTRSGRIGLYLRTVTDPGSLRILGGVVRRRVGDLRGAP